MQWHHEINRGKYYDAKYGYLVVHAPFKYAISQIIGKEGKHFKALTEKSGVHYIWYNKATEKIDIWGPTIESVNFCMLLLLQHIHGMASTRNAKYSLQ